MTSISPIEACQLCTALKLHFETDTYDFWKYNGKTNISESSFSGRKDRYIFVKLARKYNREDLTNLVLSNILSSGTGTKKLWAGNLFSTESTDIFEKYNKKMQSLSYTFEEDLNVLLNKHPNAPFMDFIKITNNEQPILLQEYLWKNISLETILTLNMILLRFIEDYWNKKIVDTVLWPLMFKKINKYRPFLNIDVSKATQIFGRTLKSHGTTLLISDEKSS